MVLQDRNGNGCALSNTYYSIGVGGSKAGAESHLTHVIQEAAMSGEFNNCKEISKDFETNCFWKVACISTFAWCCTD